MTPNRVKMSGLGLTFEAEGRNARLALICWTCVMVLRVGLVFAAVLLASWAAQGMIELFA